MHNTENDAAVEDGVMAIASLFAITALSYATKASGAPLTMSFICGTSLLFVSAYFASRSKPHLFRYVYGPVCTAVCLLFTMQLFHFGIGETVHRVLFLSIGLSVVTYGCISVLIQRTALRVTQFLFLLVPLAILFLSEPPI